jgi:hypothetical protein
MENPLIIGFVDNQHEAKTWTTTASGATTEAFSEDSKFAVQKI